MNKQEQYGPLIVSCIFTEYCKNWPMILSGTLMHHAQVIIDPIYAAAILEWKRCLGGRAQLVACINPLVSYWKSWNWHAHFYSSCPTAPRLTLIPNGHSVNRAYCRCHVDFRASNLVTITELILLMNPITSKHEIQFFSLNLTSVSVSIQFDSNKWDKIEPLWSRPY